MVVKNKKGAIEMSLNLIIMLVIGLTILGLIISFVTNFLGKAEDRVGNSLTEDDQLKLTQVQKKQGNFAFLTSTLVLEKGVQNSGKLYLKVRNPTSDQVLVSDGGLLSDSTDLSVKISGGSSRVTSSDLDYIEVYSSAIDLEAGAVGGFPINIEIVNENINTGLYFIKFETNGIGGTYTKTITLEVK